MSAQKREASQQHLLHMIESAVRAGRSEEEIEEIVSDAVEDETPKQRAA